MHYRRTQGITLIELLIGIAILGIIGAVAITSLSSLRGAQALKNSTASTVSVFHEARARTLASESASSYGVHIGTTELVLFQGAAYVAGNTGNKRVSLDDGVTISSISLAGGGTDVVFNRLTGGTNQNGTFVIVGTTPTAQKTITISKTGLISSN